MAVLLATLRPEGVLGDQSDATVLEDSRVSGAFQVPVAPLALGDLVVVPGSIEFVRFWMRVGWYSVSVGPTNPQVWMQWRVGAGDLVASDPELPPQGVGVLQSYYSLDQALQPGGAPWTVAAVNDLQLRTSWFADDASSGVATVGVVAEIGADVWGEEALPPPGPLAPDNIRAAPLRSGNIRRTLAGGRIVAPLSSENPTAPLRSGNLRGPGRPA